MNEKKLTWQNLYQDALTYNILLAQASLLAFKTYRIPGRHFFEKGDVTDEMYRRLCQHNFEEKFKEEEKHGLKFPLEQ